MTEIKDKVLEEMKINGAFLDYPNENFKLSHVKQAIELTEKLTREEFMNSDIVVFNKGTKMMANALISDVEKRIIKLIDDRRKELQVVYDNMEDKNTEFSIVHINCVHEMEDLLKKIEGD